LATIIVNTFFPGLPSEVLAGEFFSWPWNIRAGGSCSLLFGPVAVDPVDALS
jgi:hypothetical protein